MSLARQFKEDADNQALCVALLSHLDQLQGLCFKELSVKGLKRSYAGLEHHLTLPPKTAPDWACAGTSPHLRRKQHSTGLSCTCWHMCQPLFYGEGGGKEGDLSLLFVILGDL